MGMKMSRIFKAGIILAFGLCTTNALADACSEQGGHQGSGKTTQGQNNASVTGNIGSTGYHYEIWYQGGNNNMTYYDDGTFKASWNGTNDFLARVGFKYNETKTHDQIGQLDAEFKFTKQGSAGGYSYIGIYGWTVDPLVEYYIVDDWFNKPGAYLGQKKGEITIDGDTYDIYQNTRNQQPSIKGTSTFPQYFSVRRNARQCGHIDLTAHFKKWESLGMKMGKMYEAKFLVEAGGGSGSFDATYFKMTEGGSSTPKSSSSKAENVAPSSNSNTNVSTGGSDAEKVDACKEAGGHQGSGKTTQGQNNSSVTGNIGSTGYHYEIWYQGGNNSMTYYDDGTFKASWNGTNDFLARVGFKYKEDKTYKQIGKIGADFKFSKQGSAGGYSYIGIYGWTVDPLVEYYIVDDWFNKPGAYLGQKKGEITVDGDTYDIYQNTRVNQPSIKGTSTFPQYFSVRRNARQCGHIDLNAHFEKWEGLGMQMGKFYEAKFLVEAGGGSGSFDATYFRMTQSDQAPKSSSSAKAPASSSSAKVVNPQSSATNPASSATKPASSATNPASSATFPMSSGWNPNSSASNQSGLINNPQGSSSSGIDAIHKVVAFQSVAGTYEVFNMLGKYMGKVEFAEGASMSQLIKAKYGKAGIYMVKRDGMVSAISVK